MNRVFKVIQGHSFCNQSQADKGQHISSYNIAGLVSEVSEAVAIQIAKKLLSSTTPLSFCAPPRGIPANIRMPPESKTASTKTEFYME